MRATTQYSAAAFLGLAALTIMGCHDATGPTTRSIRAVVITQGESIDRDIDGYTLSVDGGPAQALDPDDAVTIPDLSRGPHLVLLGGLASNCSVGGANPRPIDVAPNESASGPLLVPFVVLCAPIVGSIRVTTATSGEDPDADGYSVSVATIGEAGIAANGTSDFNGVRIGSVGVMLSGVSANCAVDAPNPKTAMVTSGQSVDVAFTIRCVKAGALRVTIASTGAFIDMNGYDLEIRASGDAAGSRTHVSTGGSLVVPGLLGDYILTVFDIAPNCDLLQNPRAFAVTAGNETSISLSIVCETPRELAFVFDFDQDIYIIAANGTNKRSIAVPASDKDPAWSPDGGKLAFASDRNGNWDIYMMNADGTNQVRLTNVPALDVRPAWSPDGTRIAFASMRDGNSEIYLMNADGTNAVRLTNNSGSDSEPAWSPDGTRIAFTSERDAGRGIYVMNADGSGVTRLTNNLPGDWQPDWSPDGEKIAFSRSSGASRDIFTMNSDGSGVAQLTHDIPNASDPDWSPDGRKIALGSTPNNCGFYDYYCDPYIAIVSIDGIPYSDLTTFAGDPAWRP